MITFRTAAFSALLAIVHSTPLLADSGSVFELLEQGNTEAVAQVIEGDPAALQARNASGDTLLLIAAREGDMKAVQMLLDAGADVNALNNSRRDILNIAVTTKNPELVRMALAAGADATMITSVYEGSALIYGSAKGQDEIVEMLLAAGAPVDRVNNIGWTALLEVVILGDGSGPYVRITKMLLDAGADKTMADKDGRTPLDHAKARGHHNLANLLSD